MSGQLDHANGGGYQPWQKNYFINQENISSAWKIQKRKIYQWEIKRGQKVQKNKKGENQDVTNCKLPVILNKLN